jgi:DMSO reductase anchor subunit
MRPAFSVVFLTTLIGAGQGLFIVLFLCELLGIANPTFLIGGSLITLVLCGLGLLSSFFHLGHPERAWRSAAMWRTSWLSREVIALPAFMGAVFVYGVAHWLNLGYTLLLGFAGVVLSLTLFICTAMIYAAIKVLKEWAHPLTLVNFILLGCASGTTLATAFSSFTAPDLTPMLGHAAFILTGFALSTRAASLLRNAKLSPVSTLQSAIGIRHPHIVQKTQGAMGGSFNTREFFHGKSANFIKTIVPAFLVMVFFVPLALVLYLPLLAFLVQYAGLIAERWFFFAEAKHPQSLYYQTVS